MEKITWNDIVKANATISTTDIKGKDYAEVNQRVKAFRMVYPTGGICTELISDENGVCRIRATVGYYDEASVFVTLATGTAYERESATYINKTSYIENCETSAVGRALGFCGFGIDTSICSAEELTNALNQQKQTETSEAPKPKRKNPDPVPTVFEPMNEIIPGAGMPSESWEDIEWRRKALAAIPKLGLDKSCMNNFGTDFDHTPVGLIRAKLPQIK